MERIEIITIGDELLEGRLVDTNAGRLSDRLSDAGYAVARHTSVGDDHQEIIAALREAVDRSAAVLVSGGLGPTSDDLTADAAAKAFELPIKRSQRALEHVRRFFSERGRTMSHANEKQADLPAGCVILDNPRGTAVGFGLTVRGCRLYFMPGVPRELLGMFGDVVLPDLQRDLTPAPPRIATLKIFGTGESDVAEALHGLEDELPPSARLTIQYRATFPEIHVRLVLRSGSDDGRELIDGLMSEACQRLQRHVYACGRGSLETTFPQVVINDLLEKGARIGVVDLFTGGLVTHSLASDPRHTEVVAGGFVVGDATVTVALGPMEEEFPDDGTAHTEHLARLVRDRFDATLGVAIAGAPDAPFAHREETVWVAVADGRGATSRELYFPIERDRQQRIAAHAALALIRRSLSTVDTS